MPLMIMRSKSYATDDNEVKIKTGSSMAAMCFPKLEVFITRLQTGTLQNLVCKQTSAFSNITSPNTKLELDLQRCTCHCKNQYDGHNSYGAHLILIQFGKPIHTHSPWGDEINVRKLIFAISYICHCTMGLTCCYKSAY